MIPEVNLDVFGSIAKKMEEIGTYKLFAQFVEEQPALALMLFDLEQAHAAPLIMLYFGIKSQMEADALDDSV